MLYRGSPYSSVGSLLAASALVIACSAVGGGGDDGNSNGGTSGSGGPGSGATGSGATGAGATGAGATGAGATGAGATGAGATGAGATGAGATGAGGTGGECTPVTSRCDCVVQGDGVSNIIDAFEDGDMTINVIDGRDGDWFQATAKQSGENLGTMVIEPGGANGTANALHMSGGATTINPPEGEGDDWATFGVPLGQCYNAGVYTGIRFWIKGNPGAGNTSVRFSLSTPPTTEVSSGGTCPDGDLLCYDHFGFTMTVGETWELKELAWSSLTQNNWGIQAPAGYAKEQNIMAINFAPELNTEGYDFWIDEVEFMAGDGGNCGDIITPQLYDAFFPPGSRNSLYTYDGFVEAAKSFPLFCGEGTPDDRKRDAAALFGNVVQETASLVYVNEIDCPGAQKCTEYCDPANTQYPCAGGQLYFGRGPMQLSWNYNYGAAGAALGLPFLSNPNSVVASGANAWRAALWFWMTRQPLKSPHTAIVTGEGFGETIRITNGPLECDGQNPGAVTNRVNAYTNFCSQLGVDPGTNQGC